MQTTRKEMKCSYNKDWETTQDWVRKCGSVHFVYHPSTLETCPTLSHTDGLIVLLSVWIWSLYRWIAFSTDDVTVRGAIAAGPKSRTQRQDRSWSEGEQVHFV